MKLGGAEMNHNMTPAQQTLFIPLLGRALYLHDEMAKEILNKMLALSPLFSTIRSYYVDIAVKKYLKEKEDGIIINLGCGLDTIFQRHDNGKLVVANVDYYDVIEY